MAGATAIRRRERMITMLDVLERMLSICEKLLEGEYDV